MEEKIIKIMSFISAIFVFWVFASYINVLMHNESDCIYAWWNIFAILYL